MIKTLDLRQKEVINTKNGSRLGLICDFEIDLENGILKGIVVPGETNKIMSIFSNKDYFIPWQKIKHIGVDVILVELDETYEYKDDATIKRNTFI